MIPSSLPIRFFLSFNKPTIMPKTSFALLHSYLYEWEFAFLVNPIDLQGKKNNPKKISNLIILIGNFPDVTLRISGDRFHMTGLCYNCELKFIA